MAKTHLRHKETMYDVDDDVDDNLDKDIHFEVYIDETNSRLLDKNYPNGWIESYKDFLSKLHKGLAMMNTLELDSNKQLQLLQDLECSQRLEMIQHSQVSLVEYLTHFELFVWTDKLKGNLEAEFYIFYYFWVLLCVDYLSYS
jgi:hypothetical protein